MRGFRQAARRVARGEMSFLDHLDALRGVLVASAIAVLGTSVVYWFYSGRILDWLVAAVPVDYLIFSAPSEALMVRTRLSFTLGGLTSFPYVAYRVWRFVTPGLFANESRRIMSVVVASSVLFYVGTAFCYFFVAPAVVNFMLGYATEHVRPMITVGAYFDTVLRMCFAFGLVFQLPVAMLLISLTGLVTPGLFLRQWRWAIVIIFIASAIFTPPDPVSQVLMATPLCVLYIGSALVSLVVVRRRERESEAS